MSVQNSWRQQARMAAWRIAPPALVRRLFAGRIGAITAEIRALDVAEGGLAPVPGAAKPLPWIRLTDGPVLIGHTPQANERAVAGPLACDKGLQTAHAKVLIDAVVRYRHPHAAVPILDLPYPPKARAMFHLQHRDLPQQDPALDTAAKTRIRAIFTPQPGWAVLDIGAYLGHGATWLAEQVTPTGTVIAIEAMPENTAIAASGLIRNGFDHAQVLNAAIWHDAGGTIDLNTTSRQGNAIAGDVIDSARKVSVPTTSLPALTAMLGRPADLVSLTVNGAEVEALQGMSAMPATDLPHRMVMPGWYAQNGVPRAGRLTKMLESLGYQVLVTSGHFVMAWR